MNNNLEKKEKQLDGKQMLADYKFYSGNYSKYKKKNKDTSRKTQIFAKLFKYFNKKPICHR